jgi:RHS repeat-associated protein
LELLSLYIADTGNARIRRVGPDGIVTTVAGTGNYRYGYYDGEGGLATQASFNPLGIAVGPNGNLYFADAQNNRILRIATALPGIGPTDFAIPAEDGSEIYIFDGTGRHLRTVHALTGTILYQFTYDSTGRLSAVRDADGNITTIEHDTSGNPIAITGPFGQRTALSVDANGYLASIANPAGETYRLAYTSDGLLSRFTDPRGNASTLAYDDLGRLLQDRDAAGGSQSLARTDLSDSYEVARATALNRVTRYRVDTLSTGNQRRLNVFPDGTRTESLIGTDGNTRTTLADGTITNLLEGPDPRFSLQAPVTKRLTTTTGGLTATLATERTVNLTDPNNLLSLISLTEQVTLNGRAITSVFNADDKTTTTTSAAGRQSTAMIDIQGRITQSQVSGLFAISNSYDSRGRLSGITQGTGVDTRTMNFSYNSDGYLQTVMDPLNRTLGYEYDAAGRITKETLPDGRQILYSYDANGNLTSLTPPGRPAHVFAYTPVDLQAQYTPPKVNTDDPSTRYTYNVDKQLTQVARPDGQTVNFDYDSVGRLSTLTLPTGQSSYAYDATTGKLTTVTAPSSTLSYTYNGALLTQNAWTGTVVGTVGYGYDNDFRVTSVTVNDANPVAYQYDADSLLIQVGDLTLSRSAENGLLTGTTLSGVTDSLSYNGFGEVTDYTAKHSGDKLFSTQYTYDKLGRITRKVETVQGETDTYDYSYDTAGRLEKVKQNGVTLSTYSYDANGNRLSHTAGGATINGSYDAQDRLTQYGSTTYSYTANGELLSKTAGGQTTAYEYDVLGNLRKVTLPDGKVIEYLIDGQNRRIGKRVDGTLVQGFLYQDQLKPIAELDGSGSIVSRFVYATRVNVPDYLIKGGNTYRIITDHLGSPRLVVDITNGAIVQRMDYDEFGNVITDTNPDFQPFGFAGGLYDRNTGLVRFGVRDYDAEIGRWTVKDPILFGGGDMSLYRYVQNNPTKHVDVTGLSADEMKDRAEGAAKLFLGTEEWILTFIRAKKEIEACSFFPGEQVMLADQYGSGYIINCPRKKKPDKPKHNTDLSQSCGPQKSNMPFGINNPNTPFGPNNPSTPFGINNPNTPFGPNNPSTPSWYSR